MSLMKTAAALGTGIALLAAVPAQAEHNGTRNTSLNSIHQPVVQRTDYVLDLPSSGGGIAATELGRLQGWLDMIQLSYGDRIYVDTGAYDDPFARRQVSELAANYGLFVSESAPVTAGSNQPGVVRVIVSRATASVPGCPNWADVTQIGGRIATGANYGCATNSNLAAMVADPNDLVLGQSGSDVADPASASKAVRAYRNRVPTGANGEIKAEATGGK